MFRSNVLVCGGTGCTSSNSEQIIEKLKEEIKAQGLEKEVNVIRTGCFGLCALGPIMVVYPEGAFYSRVTVEDVPEIVSEHLLKGRIVKRLLYQETVVDDNTTKSLNETTFYAKQMRIALRNCGVINPENIDEYIAQDGYAALGKVLTEMTPQEVIDLVLASGLRGRRFPHRPQVAVCRQLQGGTEVRLLQCRRRRPRRVHGPFRAGGRPSQRAGGHGHCRLCHRRQPGLHLHPCRVSHRCQALADYH